MAMQASIIETIGEAGLRLPGLINEGLAANDRVKYYLTLLQAAAAHAQEPLAAVPDLRGTREASGVTDVSLDDVVAASRSVADGVVFVPGAERLRQLLFDDVDRMLEPLRSSADASVHDARYETYRTRLDAHLQAAGRWTTNQLDTGVLDALTGAGDDRQDTLHRLVMDLHRELNRLLGEIALETVDGARASGLTPRDRVFVSAFMKGVNETAPLKFDHPGLGTTAARYGDRLSIQNDLGTTEGHILVVRVDALTATVFYGDIHRRRVLFLKEMLLPYAIEWQSDSAATIGGQQMIVGRFTAGDSDGLDRFLTFLGSRLVFLIDWNRARKRLARFVKKADAVAVLRWAAENNVGHCAFLQAGGVALIYSAFERVAPARIRYGARLDEMIGAAAAAAFLKAVLRIASAGAAAGHSERLIQDEVEAELLTHLETTEHKILDTAADHAMLLSALAERLRLTLQCGASPDSHDAIVRTARLAKAWETRADEIVRQSSRSIDQPDGDHVLGPLLSQADNVADALEEAAFLLTLVPGNHREDRLAPLRGLADLVGDGTKEYVRCLEAARDVARYRAQSDVRDVLLCVERIAHLEHASDAAERAAKATLVGICTDWRELQILFETTRALEQAADALARCARPIRDYVLSARAA